MVLTCGFENGATSAKSCVCALIPRTEICGHSAKGVFVGGDSSSVGFAAFVRKTPVNDRQ
jgi:hypothetical protein